MKRAAPLALALAALVAAAHVITTTRADSQSGRGKLTVAIYTPTVQFANSAARLSYVQGLAKAIGANTGMRVDGLSFTSLGKLLAARPDFAIIDGQCYAASGSGKLLANARIGGSTDRPWALYSRLGPDLTSLRGKKLAYVKTGCNDTGFIDHAMLESELGGKYFSARVGKSDLAGAVAEVATYKGAHAVFAPVGKQKGLTKVFDTGLVPTPAFVQLDSRLDGDLVSRVRAAVVGYGGSGAIAGWEPGNARSYRNLKGRMSRRIKRGLFATPDPIRIDADEVLVEPATLNDVALPEIRQNFEKPPGRQE